MEISAEQVRILREKTGLGMMLCKKALQETNGDMEKAIEDLRKQGQATAARRAGKAAKEGKVTIKIDSTTAIMYEVNAETDFVARNTDFIAFVDELGKLLMSNKPVDLTAAKALTSSAFNGRSVDDRILELVAKIGENISFRRFISVPVGAGERVFSYIHGNGKIGVLVKVAVDKTEALNSEELAALGKDLAMQVAASNPVAANRSDFPADLMAKEKAIYHTQAQTSGKPEKVWEKIVEGKVEKFYKEAVLIEQPFIRDPEKPVTHRIAEAEKIIGAKVTVKSFLRYELGAEEAS